MAAEPGWHGRLADRRVTDAAVVAALLGADLFAEAMVSAGAHVRCPPLGAAVVVASASAAILWWRRRRPLLVLALVLVSTAVAGGVVPPGLWTQHTGVPLVLAGYAVGSWSSRRVAATVVPAVLLVAVFAAVASKASAVDAALLALALVALPWVAGVAARARRRYLEEVEARLRAAEDDRDRRARDAVLEERRHIARELHDVVAHHVSLIGVQAGAARVALDDSPDLTRAALAAIEQSSRSAVGEMRHLLDVLRSDDRAGAALEPAPGLGRLDALADSFRAAGLSVDVRVEGDTMALSPVLDLSCYRVVEEALTNVATHSAAGRATVAVAVGAGDDGRRRVHLVVHDPGPARVGTAGSGRGLIGLRERVGMFAGTLSAGPVAGGGFAVDATFEDGQAW